jgi:hypothetical protein
VALDFHDGEHVYHRGTREHPMQAPPEWLGLRGACGSEQPSFSGIGLAWPIDPRPQPPSN